MSPSGSLLLITNSDAGTADRDTLNAAVGVLRAEAAVEVVATSSPDELDALLAGDDPISRERPIVIAGGDGSIHAVIAALHGAGELTGRTLGLLPLGTGNDFARTLGIPLDAAAAAHALLTGRPQPMDLLVDDTGGVVVNNVHLGAGADAGRRGKRWKERLGAIGVRGVNLGRIGYPIGAALTAMRPPVLRLRVEVDDVVVTDLDEPVLMVVLGNGASVGGGAEIAPGADPADGRIDVLIATPTGALAQLRYAAGLPFGRHADHDDVATHRGTAVTVSGSGFWCSADGELAGPVRRRSWHLEAAAYSLVVPDASESGRPTGDS